MEKKTLIMEIRNGIKKGETRKVIELLEEHSHLLNEITPFGTWLHVAAQRGNMKVIEYLINKGLDVNVKGDMFDANALNSAASAGQLEAVRYLIDKGSIMDTSLAKRNPLFGAIYGGHIDVVKELVRRGIDTSVGYTIGSNDNMNAHDYAKEFGQTEIANFLKQSIQ